MISTLRCLLRQLPHWVYDVSLIEILWIIVVVFIAATTQSISGFGFALVAVPLMSLFVSPRDAVVVATFIGAFSSTSQAVIDRQFTVWTMARRLSLAAFLGMPFGLMIFVFISEFWLRLFVGIVVFVAVVVLLKGFTLHHSHRSSDWLLGGLSGVLATSTSTNGPPLVFLMQAKAMEPAIFRATISTVFSITSVGAIVLFVFSGNVSRIGVIGVLIALPVLAIGLKLGYAIRPRVDAQRFRSFVFLLLTLSALSSFSAAFFR